MTTLIDLWLEVAHGAQALRAQVAYLEKASAPKQTPTTGTSRPARAPHRKRAELKQSSCRHREGAQPDRAGPDLARDGA